MPVDCTLQAVQDPPPGIPRPCCGFCMLLGSAFVQEFSRLLKHCTDFSPALEALLSASPYVPSCDT